SEVAEEAALRRIAVDRLSWPILRQLLRDAIGRGATRRPADLDDLLHSASGAVTAGAPTVTGRRTSNDAWRPSTDSTRQRTKSWSSTTRLALRRRATSLPLIHECGM